MCTEKVAPPGLGCIASAFLFFFLVFFCTKEMNRRTYITSASDDGLVFMFVLVFLSKGSMNAGLDRLREPSRSAAEVSG